MSAAPSMQHLAAIYYRKKAKEMGMDIQIVWSPPRIDNPQFRQRVVLICGKDWVQVEVDTWIHPDIDMGLERLKEMRKT